MLILGIDPGVNTGVATYIDGKLTQLQTISPAQIARHIGRVLPGRVIFEDSRLQSYTWTQIKSRAAALKMARNVGEVDAWCRLITEVCAELGITAHGISPKGKGAKLNAAQFAALTGWTGSSNEHTRDAGAVAWKYRGARA
ncbi:hypothetical protein BH10PSE16_BH10PSE16_01060 [soil metagenome]